MACDNDPMPQSYEFDVLIIGSGAAGLTVALNLPEHLQVAVVSKADISSGATLWAQGGIAAVLDDDDSLENHISDTLKAGGGLCHEDAVRFTVEHGRESIDWLIDSGVTFTRDDESHYHLTREGGHSHRRIIHAADATGHAVSTTLTSQAQARANITLMSSRVAVDLITNRKLSLPGNACVGAYILNLEDNHVELFRARFTILATGGASKAYRYTTNPDGASGDGIAMAWRAGCRVGNMEFNQFHPTCLYHPHAKSFLITEAVRGEGGVLLLPDGTRFMDRFDERGELAPRDIVARAIDHEMKRLGADHLYLDISHKPADFITHHFPTIYEKCLIFGIDITKEPIPVVPAAHYTCGGILSDQRARTDINQLYVVGEAAFTGLHGANRMASNSLLECLVFARSCARRLRIASPSPPGEPTPARWGMRPLADDEIEEVHEAMRQLMSTRVAIVRTDQGLAETDRRLARLHQRLASRAGDAAPPSLPLANLWHALRLARLTVECARRRRESRGLHFNPDCPRHGEATPHPSRIRLEALETM